MSKSSYYSISLPEFGVFSVLDFSHSYMYAVFHYCFNMHFPDDIWYRVTFHRLTCHLYIFCSEVSAKVFVFSFFFFFFSFIFISWRLITLQYCSGFCHTLTWISHGFTRIPQSRFPLSPPSPVFPVHQARALVSCIQPGLVICFTLDNIHVSMLFSWNIPPSPSPPESKSLFCTSVSFSVLHIGLSLASF